MHPILFLDNYCIQPYDLDIYKNSSVAGTSCSIIRVAEKLSEKIPVVIGQHKKSDITRSQNVIYGPFKSEYAKQKWHAVVILRNPKLALDVRETLSDVPMWLWMHDPIDYKMLPFLEPLAKKNIHLVFVSKYHQKMFTDLPMLYDPLIPQMPHSEVVYNPIEDELHPDSTPINKNKLVFASSPHKGLRYTLESFKELKKQYPQFELYVSNPGYMAFPENVIPGVTYLGGIPYEQNIQHLRSALCLYYPNHAFPETFGLVFTDANAVGTPVITHPLGPAVEVLNDDRQLVNTHDVQALIDRVVSWHEGNRPQVSVNTEFRISQVAKRWEQLLEICG